MRAARLGGGFMIAAAVIALGLGVIRSRDVAFAGGAPLDRISYQDWADVLRRHVSLRAGHSSVDYAALRASPQRLLRFVNDLGRLRAEAYERMSQAEQIALWINAYNALTLEVVVAHYPIRPWLLAPSDVPDESIRQIPGVWRWRRYRVAGRKVTLDEIEHAILRREFAEPRIHMALNCASRGCPALRTEPYVAERLEEQLADQSRVFLSRADALRLDPAAGEVRLSPIFSWFGDDFYRADAGPLCAGTYAKAESAALGFAARHATPEQAALIRRCNLRLAWGDYDWALNDASGP